MILFAGIVAFALAAGLTPLVRRWALRRQVVDNASLAPERKIHPLPIPLGGGLAIFLAFTLVSWTVALLTPDLFGGFFLPKYLVGITVAGGILIVGGYLDDRYHFTARRQIVFPILAALGVIACGIGVTYITNPFGGTLDLSHPSWQLFTLGGQPYRIILFADLFAFLWLLATTYTTKILDGLDGLVAGVTTIGGIIIAVLSMTKEVTQPETALLAVILAGAAAGFLVWNWHPAKIFLGEGGSTYTGFMLGTLAIIAGGKIATALLILGIPALDVAWAILRRLTGKRKATQADRGHLHFRLLDAGLTVRQAVLLLYTVTAVFGSVTLVTRGEQKVYALIALALVMVILATSVILAYKKNSPRSTMPTRRKE
ncbi:MAG: MraY family glycosyltransferase [bacterium]|nr:MraY family glycosyltransferase [bacterium]